MFNRIPDQRPHTKLLDSINCPADLRLLDTNQLPQLAYELREFLLYSVGQTGGHFGAGLGVIELTIALHYLANTPEDQIIWDVGHQSYPHKILTGRREQMLSIRQADGLSPFPKRAESRYDAFGTGHSSTSISAALGMAIAHKLDHSERRAIAVIGDGALTAGMAFEALNHAAHTQANLLVILNDNDMSISPNEGGLATYLAKNLPLDAQQKASSAALFEALAFEYQGPIDGHDFSALLPALDSALNKPGAQFLHITTQKGKGFAPAELDPVGFHAITKIEPITLKPGKKATFADHFGQWLVDTAAKDTRLIGITPAMKEGSNLVAFAEQFPERFFDVAIAEQHALTLAAGMACAGKKPVVAIYSTFLQRAYDQLIHDIAIQKLDVLLAIDRAGLVGEDGATHAGCFDISFLRCIPDMVLMTPADEQEHRLMLNTGYQHEGPAAVRYPRGSGSCANIEKSSDTLAIGKARVINEGASGVVILNFGVLLEHALQLALEHDLTLIDMRFVKPLDEAMLISLSKNHSHFITLEDQAVMGGAGSAVIEFFAEQNITANIKLCGIPDMWIDHATRSAQVRDHILNKLDHCVNELI